MEKLDKIFEETTKVLYDDVEIYMFLAEVGNDLTEDEKSALRNRFEKYIETSK